MAPRSLDGYVGGRSTNRLPGRCSRFGTLQRSENARGLAYSITLRESVGACSISIEVTAHPNRDSVVFYFSKSSEWTVSIPLRPWRPLREALRGSVSRAEPNEVAAQFYRQLVNTRATRDCLTERQRSTGCGARRRSRSVRHRRNTPWWRVQERQRPPSYRRRRNNRRNADPDRGS